MALTEGCEELLGTC